LDSALGTHFPMLLLPSLLAAFTAMPAALLPQDVIRSDRSTEKVVDDRGTAHATIRMKLEPESEPWKYWQAQWGTKDTSSLSVKFIPRELDRGDSHLHPTTGLCRKGRNSGPSMTTIVWPAWKLEGSDFVMKVGQIRAGDWWVYLSSEDLGQTLPTLVTVTADQDFTIEVDANSFQVAEKWIMHFPKLPPAWLQAPVAFEQVGGAPFTQTGTGLEDVLDDSQFMFDPRSDCVVFFTNSYGLNELQANGGYFWSVSLKELRAKAKKDDSPLTIDLSLQMPTLSAVLAPDGKGNKLRDGGEGGGIGFRALPDENGVYPLFPGDFFGALTSNYEVRIYGLPPGSYQIMRYSNPEGREVQSLTVEVKGPQFEAPQKQSPSQAGD
jgi:hypothetical protein